MDAPPYDGDYFLGADYSHNGTDSWTGVSYVFRNQLNNWFASRCCGVSKTEPTLGETGEPRDEGMA